MGAAELCAADPNGQSAADPNEQSPAEPNAPSTPALNPHLAAPLNEHLPAGLNGEFAAGLIETDNVQRVATHAMSDTIGELLADFTLHEQTRRTDADILSNLQYLTYARGIYPHQVIGNFAGNGKYAFVPGELEWIVQDNFGQQQLNPATAINPTNLENINYFSTGPDWLLTFNPSLQAELAARYSRVSYQRSDLDSNQAEASAALVHPLSATTSVSLHAEGEKVSYVDSVANPDFTTERGFVRYDSEGGRSRATLDLGADRVTGVSSNGTGLLIQAAFSHALSASSRLEIAGGQDVSNNGDFLRQLQGLNGVAVSAASLQSSNDPFVNRFGSVAWKFDRNRTNLSVDLQRFAERHLDNTALDQVRVQADAILRRALTPQTAATVGASYVKATYSGTTDSYHGAVASAAFEWRIQRRLDVKAEYDHFYQRGAVVTNTFGENRISLTVGVRIGVAR